MINRVKNYYETELKRTENWLNNPLHKTEEEKRQVVWYAIQRCFGVSDFVKANYFNVDHMKLDELFELHKEKLNKLLDKSN